MWHRGQPFDFRALRANEGLRHRGHALDAFERASGIAPPRRHIPFAVAEWIGRLQRWRANLFGIEPDLTDEIVGIYRHEWAYSSERAVRELQYSITSLDRGIEQTVAWLRETGRM